MRFLFTTQPGTGHLLPLLPVARGLRAAGHEVAVATSAAMAPEVTAAGFAHHGVGRPWLAADMPRAFPELASIPPGPERYAWARRRIFAHDTALDVVPDLLQLAMWWRPDVLVREAAEYGGCVAAEVLDIPHAMVRTDSGSSSYGDRGHVADVLDEVRARFGLPSDPAGDAPFRHLVLSFAPPGLDEDELAPTCVQLRPPAPDCRPSAPAWFADLPTRAPVVYATLGTVYNSPELLRAILTGLAFEPLELVLTSAGREIPGPLPPNAHVVPWIPQDAVLPHCAAVVTHGGYGTVSAALGYGLPMVLVPISADQPLNARRLTGAGVGITIGPDDRTPGSIRAATRAVLQIRRTGRPRAASPTREPIDPGCPPRSICSSGWPAHGGRRPRATAGRSRTARRRRPRLLDVSDLVELTAVEQRRLIGTKEVSAGELLDAHLARIDAVNPSVNAIVAYDPEVGRARARAVDDATAAGEPVGALAGLVTAHKDLEETADFPTTYGSPLFAGHRPAEDCLLVARMKAAGAVAVGKTNTPEFGAGSHTFNNVYGVTKNPWDLARTAGGSSGGAAVSLACRMLATADGSDTGGSLRNPAAWNNVVGFRPTVRVVPHVGPGNAWMPISTRGPMGRTVDDVALLLGVLAAPDPRDPMHRPFRVAAPLTPPDRPLRVAWSPDLGVPVETSQREVLAGTRQAMVDLGWEVVDAEPELAAASDCFRVLRAWTIANGPTARFSDRMDEIKATIQDEIRRGAAVTSSEVATAYEQLAALWRETVAFFDQGYDLLACPVTQVSPFPVEVEYPTLVAGRQLSNYIDWMASCWRITVTGCPTLSLPAGFDVDGLPVGVQLVTRQGADGPLLRAAKALEEATGFAARRPPVVPS